MAHNSGEEGATALEALIAIALLSVALGSLVAGSRGGIAALGRVRTTAEETAAILRADDALRSAAARVRIPYWARDAEPETEDGRLSVPWYEGKADRKLVLSSGADGLAIAGGEDLRRVPGIADARLSVLRGREGQAAGIEAAFVLRGREVRVAAAFGSAAVGQGSGHGR